MRFSIEKYGDVTSTNDVIKSRIDEGADEGLAVLACSQSGGYGRRGNAWASPKGGHYLSVLLRPEKDISELPSLSHVAAIAVRRAIAQFIGADEMDAVKIKWPNDIVYMSSESAGDNSGSGTSGPLFRKICGISVERHNGAICMGIGINVFRPKGDMTECAIPPQNDGSEDGDFRNRNQPTYLEDLMDDKASGRFEGNENAESIDPVIVELADCVLDELGEVYEIWQGEGFCALRDEYMSHFALEGFRARIGDDADRAINCEVKGIDEGGNLEVIPFGEKEVKKISAGRVRVL